MLHLAIPYLQLTLQHILDVQITTGQVARDRKEVFLRLARNDHRCFHTTCLLRAAGSAFRTPIAAGVWKEIWSPSGITVCFFQSPGTGPATISYQGLCRRLWSFALVLQNCTKLQKSKAPRHERMKTKQSSSAMSLRSTVNSMTAAVAPFRLAWICAHRSACTRFVVV